MPQEVHDPLILAAEEQERILVGCADAAALGYETEAGSLLPVAVQP